MSGEGEKEPRPSLLNKCNYILLMFVTAGLILAFTYYFLFSNPSAPDETSCADFFRDVPATGTRAKQGLSAQTESASYIQISGMPLKNKNEYFLEGHCDLFSGQWLSNSSGPAYTNISCNFIEGPQNCMRNGRPDINYLYWRWKPHGCELPPFDPSKFLEAMKDKSWAFIGDSIFRNHIQSMLCFLNKVEEPAEIYHDKTFKSRTWHFANHNFTISVIWAPFLVKSELPEHKDDEIHIHLDALDEKWTTQYAKYDYVILSGGQWFLKTMVMSVNNTTIGCHNCKNRSLKELGVSCPYRKALRTAYQFMASSDHKPFIFFRTWTPDHFEYGEWFSGGLCNRTSPYSEGQYNGKPIDRLMRDIELEEFNKAADMASLSGARLRLLDTFHLSLLRPDGHPGPYRTFHPFGKDKEARVQNDCLHWCLPGPIDTWNELIMKILVDERDISYS